MATKMCLSIVKPLDVAQTRLDKILAKPIDPQSNLDRSKESCWPGCGELYRRSHEFLPGLCCLQECKRSPLPAVPGFAGHFHPLKRSRDKLQRHVIPSGALLHVHAACAGTATMWLSSTMICKPSPRKLCGRVPLTHPYRPGLLDASINRIAAWAIGSRNTLRALLWHYWNHWTK